MGMRRLFLKLSLAVPGAAILSVAQTESSVKKISADELKKMMADKKKFFFLDVREPKEIEELGTIDGYVNIPLTQLEQRMREIPKDALVLTA
jgi:rhodanese-related sulfurtransferase